MYIIGLENDTRAYFTIITIFISLPTGTKIFNWLSTYLSFLFYLNIISLLILLFILMFTLGGTTGIILGNSIIDFILHDTYYIIAHFHFILSLGAIISLLSIISFNIDFIFISKNLLPFIISYLYFYHLYLIFIGILLSFSPMHFIGFNIIPRRIPDYLDSIHTWNLLSSISSILTISSLIFI